MINNGLDLRKHWEIYIFNQDIAQIMKAGRLLDNAGDIPVDLLVQAFEQARSWHTNGYFLEQKELCLWMVKYDPGFYEAYHLLGFHAQMDGDFALAETLYKQALSLNPQFAFSKLALSQIQMLRSYFKEGIAGYEARFDALTEGSGPDLRGLPFARWKGESVEGQNVYIWAEQGLGDVIMFASFLPYLIAQQPKRIVLGMFPRLLSVFARAFPQIVMESIEQAVEHAILPLAMTSYPQIEKIAQLSPTSLAIEPLRASHEYAALHGIFDVSVPMADLLIHGVGRYIPAQHQKAYLQPDKQRAEEMKSYLDSLGPGIKVGISWYTHNVREANRNVPLELWLPLLTQEKCHFISLQHRVLPEDIQVFCERHGCMVHTDHGIGLMEDAEGLVALVASMDKVITIDNSNAHLAGALGISTTLLLPKGHNFRWPLLEEKTYWYDSVSIIRQETVGDWESVLAKAHTVLAKQISSSF